MIALDLLHTRTLQARGQIFAEERRIELVPFVAKGRHSLVDEPVERGKVLGLQASGVKRPLCQSGQQRLYGLSRNARRRGLQRMPLGGEEEPSMLGRTQPYQFAVAGVDLLAGWQVLLDFRQDGAKALQQERVRAGEIQ